MYGTQNALEMFPTYLEGAPIHRASHLIRTAPPFTSKCGSSGWF